MSKERLYKIKYLKTQRANFQDKPLFLKRQKSTVVWCDIFARDIQGPLQGQERPQVHLKSKPFQSSKERLFMTKHTLRIFGESPFFKQQNKHLRLRLNANKMKCRLLYLKQRLNCINGGTDQRCSTLFCHISFLGCFKLCGHK